MAKLGVLFVIGIILNSCIIKKSSDKGPVDSKSESSPTTTTTIAQSDYISGIPDKIARQNQLYSFSPTLHEDGLVFYLENAPSWLNLDPLTGTISGIPKTMGSFNNIILSAIKSGSTTKLGPFSILGSGDPLYGNQWHIVNSGQTSYASGVGVSGMDLNMAQAMKDGITGSGVQVAISDTGLDVDHPDLFSNVDLHACKNYNSSHPYFGDPEPNSVDNDHGTSVAGIVGAIAWNGKGIRGVSPKVTLAGLNFISSSQSILIQLDQADGDFDIFNYSYGTPFYIGPISYEEDYYDKVKNGFLNKRGGLGQNYVKAAGNSFIVCDFQSDDNLVFSSNICLNHSANHDPENNIPYMIVVGALNAKGVKSSYSSVGSSLWISAFGGEFGVETPAIITLAKPTFI